MEYFVKIHIDKYLFSMDNVDRYSTAREARFARACKGSPLMCTGAVVGRRPAPVQDH